MASASPLLHPHPFTICGPSKFSSRGSVSHDHVSGEWCLSSLLWLDAEEGKCIFKA